jgi:diaminohydroxyphosphoribosylaminopyrimidine deaminase/5-amino-6-(5-phosphoribosylamino)uracil reductase
MQRCLDLALLGAGYVAPNPMVGAVLVYEDKVIGEGYHQQYGGPHAEVNCINSVLPEQEALISKSTLYVSLEPCVHFGKTPPCTDLIIKKNIPEVVIGCRDSYDEVNGKGIDKLRANGIHVVTGVLERESLELNRRFFTFHQQQRPYIIIKWAQTRDGKISWENNERSFISNEYSNRLVHKWRTEEAAIMVGTNTALLDDPALTARLWPGNSPVRIVIDMQLNLPLSLHLFDGTVKTIVFNQQKQEESGMIIYHRVDRSTPIIPQIMNALFDLQLQSVLVEGGAKLLQSFIDARLWDEARVIRSEKLLVGSGQLVVGSSQSPTGLQGVNAPILINHELIQTQEIATDIINIYQRQH